MKNIRHLGEDRILALVIRYSAPAIAGMVIYGLNRIVGNIFVGKFLGREAMAGFTVANSLVMILLSFVMLVGTGSSVLISMSLGKKDFDRASIALGTAVTVGFALGVLLASLMFIFSEPLLRAFGAEGQSLEFGSAFIRVYLAGSVFSFWNTTLNSAIRAEGQPGKAFVTNIVSFVLNTALTPVFLFALPMGIKGVALANILSQFALTLWLGSHFVGKRTILPLRPSSFKIDPSIAIRLFVLGAVPFFMQFLGACMSLVTNNIVKNLAGDLGLAVAGSVFSVYFLLIMPLQGTSTGIQPIIGYNFGAANHQRVRRTVLASLGFTAAICVVEMILATGFRVRLASLFTSGDTALVTVCASGLLMILLAFPIAGVQFVASSYFLGTGKAKEALAVNLFRSLFVLIPLLTLPRRFGMTGLFVSYPLVDVLVAVLGIILTFDGMRKAGRTGVYTER
jgi:putative MATE family efflux protein